MKLRNLRTRREFLCNCGVAGAGLALPHFLLHTARAVGQEAGWEPGSGAALPGFKDDRVLVVVQLSGGNDGLNTIIPHSDDQYFRVRPKLGLQGNQRMILDDQTSMHKNLAPLKALYDLGLLNIVEGVGYPNPDRSHFRSMEIWHTGCDSDEFPSSGWVGRYFDNACSGKPEPVAGLFIGQELPQAFDGKNGIGVAFRTPESFGYVAGKKGDDMRSFRAINRRIEERNPTLDFLRHVTETANISTDKIHEVARRAKNKANYPNSQIATDLAIVARMIAGGLPTRLYYVALGGFDTHANQLGQQERLLEQYAQAVSAFMDDLGKLGQSERVLVMTFSEFGRRVEENASGGTDHGTAAPMFLIGSGVKPGLAGKRPSLTDLDRGDLKYTTDFRSVYASVLKDWFDVKPEIVLERDFPTLPVVKA